MGWYSDLLKAYPALADEVERIRLLDEENRKRIRERAARRVECNGNMKCGQFTEFKGVFWTEHDGMIDTAVYCPACEIAMEVISSEANEKLVCARCDYTAPFAPIEIDTLARSLESKRRSS